MSEGQAGACVSPSSSLSSSMSSNPPSTRPPSLNTDTDSSTDPGTPNTTDQRSCERCRMTITESSYAQETSTSTKLYCSSICLNVDAGFCAEDLIVCDWCREKYEPLRRVYLQESEDSVTKLAFCSENCVNNYRMEIFCSELANHSSLSSTDAQITAADEDLPLITPDSWRQQNNRLSPVPFASKSSEPNVQEANSRVRSKAVFVPPQGIPEAAIRLKQVPPNKDESRRQQLKRDSVKRRPLSGLLGSYAKQRKQRTEHRPVHPPAQCFPGSLHQSHASQNILQGEGRSQRSVDPKSLPGAFCGDFNRFPLPGGLPSPATSIPHLQRDWAPQLLEPREPGAPQTLLMPIPVAVPVPVPLPLPDEVIKRTRATAATDNHSDQQVEPVDLSTGAARHCSPFRPGFYLPGPLLGRNQHLLRSAESVAAVESMLNRDLLPSVSTDMLPGVPTDMFHSLTPEKLQMLQLSQRLMWPKSDIMDLNCKYPAFSVPIPLHSQSK